MKSSTSTLFSCHQAKAALVFIVLLLLGKTSVHGQEVDCSKAPIIRGDFEEDLVIRNVECIRIRGAVVRGRVIIRPSEVGAPEPCWLEIINSIIDKGIDVRSLGPIIISKCSKTKLEATLTLRI